MLEDPRLRIALHIDRPACLGLDIDHSVITKYFPRIPQITSIQEAYTGSQSISLVYHPK